MKQEKEDKSTDQPMISQKPKANEPIAGLEGSNYSNSGFDNDSLPVRSVASKDGKAGASTTLAGPVTFDKKPSAAADAATKPKPQDDDLDEEYSLEGDEEDEDYSEDVSNTNGGGRIDSVSNNEKL